MLTGGIRVLGNEKVEMIYGIVLYGEALEEALGSLSLP